MFDLTQVLLIIIVIVLTAVFTAIGFQLYFLLKALRVTTSKADKVLDQADHLIKEISHPTASINQLLSGIKQGVGLFEGVMSFFTTRKSKDYGAE